MTARAGRPETLAVPAQGRAPLNAKVPAQAGMGKAWRVVEFDEGVRGARIIICPVIISGMEPSRLEPSCEGGYWEQNRNLIAGQGDALEHNAICCFCARQK